MLLVCTASNASNLLLQLVAGLQPVLLLLLLLLFHMIYDSKLLLPLPLLLRLANFLTQF